MFCMCVCILCTGSQAARRPGSEASSIHRSREVVVAVVYKLGLPRRGVSKPTVYNFPQLPLYEICIIVWDSGLQLTYENRERNL